MQPKCANCKYYYITWDKTSPHGCKALGFKSKRLPSVIVKQESNQECLSFELQTRLKKKQNEIDFKDPKLW